MRNIYNNTDDEIEYLVYRGENKKRKCTGTSNEKNKFIVLLRSYISSSYLCHLLNLVLIVNENGNRRK